MERNLKRLIPAWARIGSARRLETDPETVLGIFQYWHADMPDDVRVWTQSVKAGGAGIGYNLLNEELARDAIRRSHGARYVKAFDACALPAMQADYLRLCLMDAEGGLWIDAGYECLRPLDSFLETAGDAFVPAIRGPMYNGVLLFRKPGNEFVRVCLEIATTNIETRRCSKVVVATGPGVFNAVRWLLDRRWRRSLRIHARFLGRDRWGWPELVSHVERSVRCTPELISAYESLSSLSPDQLGGWLTSRFGAYKGEQTHWSRWSREIYK